LSENLLLVFEIIGTIAFAVSGAMVGLSKKMDIFGIAVLGTVTSVGGGVIRDLVLGNTPPATFQNPVYALVAIFVSLIIFIPAVRRFLFRKQSFFEKPCALWIRSDLEFSPPSESKLPVLRDTKAFFF